MNTQVHLDHLTTSPNVDARLPRLLACAFTTHVSECAASVSPTPQTKAFLLPVSKTGRGGCCSCMATSLGEIGTSVSRDARHLELDACDRPGRDGDR